MAVHFQYLTDRPTRPSLAPVRSQYRSSTPRRDLHLCTAAPPEVKSMCENITFNEAENATPSAKQQKLGTFFVVVIIVKHTKRVTSARTHHPHWQVLQGPHRIH